MDVSVIIPVRSENVAAIPWDRRCAGLEGWPGTQVQLVGVSCGPVPHDQSAPWREVPACPKPLAVCLESDAYRPEAILPAALKHCEGDVIVWLGGPSYPKEAIRWLSEATSRYDFVIAQPQRTPLERLWSRLTRLPRLAWSGRTVKRPSVQLWAVLRETLDALNIEQLRFQKLPQEVKACGYRVGQLLLPRFSVENELRSSQVHPWQRLGNTRPMTRLQEAQPARDASVVDATMTYPLSSDSNSNKSRSSQRKAG